MGRLDSKIITNADINISKSHQAVFIPLVSFHTAISEEPFPQLPQSPEKQSEKRKSIFY